MSPGPNHKDGCDGSDWRYSGEGYHRVRLCRCGAEDHAPDTHKTRAIEAIAVAAALHSAERDVLEACVAWVLASDARVEDSTRGALLNVGMRYCALLEAESKLRNQ